RLLVLPVPGLDGTVTPAVVGFRCGSGADCPCPAPEPELRPAPAQVRAPAEQPAALFPADGHLLFVACRTVPAGVHDPRRVRRTRRRAQAGRERVPAPGTQVPQGT